MTLSLPAAVSTYFALGNGETGVEVGDCFAADAVVADEHQQHEGVGAIRHWLGQTRVKYDYQAEPLRVEQRGDGVVVHARVTGSFPGGEVELAYAFVLDGAKIQRLDIQ